LVGPAAVVLDDAIGDVHSASPKGLAAPSNAAPSVSSHAVVTHYEEFMRAAASVRRHRRLL
ncbi:MAG TPA: hypothetical protein VIG84_13260, partial [Brevundimonas sp.]